MDVSQTIGEVLPLAVVIAISPIPLIAVILMLFSGRARINSAAFSAGWLVGVAVGLFLLTSIVGTRDLSDASGADEVSGTQLVLGVILILLAVRAWRRRSGPEGMPGWMSKVETMGPLTAVGMGLLLSVVNPKNLLLLVAAAVDIAAADLDTADTVTVVLVFTVVASLTVVGLTLARLVAGARVQPWLDELKAWLTAHAAAVTAALLLLIGVALVGKGLGVLS